MKKVIEKLPFSWTEKPLKENNSFLRRGKSPKYCETNQGLLVINQDCIRWDCIDLDKVKFHVVPNRIDDSFFLRPGDILINSTGTGTIGRINYWSYPAVKAVADSHVTILRVKEESINSKYVQYFLSSELGQRYLESICYTGSTNQIELSKRYLSKLSLPCGPLLEQKAIAGVITKVDEAIEAVQNSIKSAEFLQKSLMQNLLTGKMKPDGTWRREDDFFVDEKFGKVPKGWKVTRLKDVCKKAGEYGANASAIDFHNDLPRFIRITDIDDKGNLIEDGKASIEKDKSSNYILHNNDFLIARTGDTVGKSLLYKEHMGYAAFAGYLIKFIFKEDLIVPEYFKFVAKSDFFESFKVAMKKIGAKPNINSREYGLFKFIMPQNILHQQEIVESFSKIEVMIKNSNHKIQSLKTLKKSLMQTLLTGKVRVDVEKINKILEEV